MNGYVRDAAEVVFFDVAACRKELVEPVDGVLDLRAKATERNYRYYC